MVDRITYVQAPKNRKLFWLAKISCSIENSIFKKVVNWGSPLGMYYQKSNNRVYYRTTGGLYWKVFTDFAPAFNIDGHTGHSSRETFFTVATKDNALAIIALLSSNLFWWWYTLSTNCRDLNPYDIQNFPINDTILSDIKLKTLGQKYLADLRENSFMLTREQKQTGITQTQCFKIQKSKTFIDEIDNLLSTHYNFTQEELDFIINYDIKYRMGKELEGDE